MVGGPLLLAWASTTALHRRIYPEPMTPAAEGELISGPVHLVLRLPGTYAGIAEPLFVYGSPGNATLAYIRLLPGAKAQVGVELWGYKKIESDEFSIPPDQGVIRVDCSVPSFYQNQAASYWEGMDPSLSQVLRRRILLAVDGQVRLRAEYDYVRNPNAILALGANPLGGSVVSSRFTGTVLSPKAR